ncbi:MAG: ABC transporter permease, partial [Bacteroidota bacterium]
MLRLCFYKTLRDLLADKSRTILVLAAMIIGISGVGSVLNARAILSREMDRNYLRTNPASATLWVQGLNDRIVEKATPKIPGIKDIEARRTITGRVRTEDGLGTEITIFVIKDFRSLKNTTFKPEKGKWPPAKSEILIERAAMRLVKAGIGGNIEVKIPGYRATVLKLSGTVHAPALPPAWMENLAYGFISLETYETMGGKDGLNEFKFVVAKDPMDRKHIREITSEVVKWFQSNGLTVQRVEIPKPGKHPHASQMETLLFLLQAFGLLTFILSAIIVANVISALLSRQIRQIGMMKAVGSKNSQIVSIYLSQVLTLGIISLTVALPLAVSAGRACAFSCANILNFQIFSQAIPFTVTMIQIGIGLALPLIAAAYSIIRGSRITVREALQDYGVTLKKDSGRDESLLSGLSGVLSRPFLLSIRNTFRKKGRLLFTLAVLSVGGALFITALNVYAAMNTSALGFIKSFQYDAAVRLSGTYPKMALEKEVSQIPAVKSVEIWSGAKAERIHKDGMSGNSFNLLAITSDTRMVAPIKPEKGRWLLPDDTDAIVINHKILSLEPGLQLGDRITLKINGQTTSWKIA